MIILTARRQCKLFVSDRQEELLIGSLLGDAYVSPRGQIQLEQSSIQKEFLFWKYSELKSLAYGSPIETIRFDRRYNKSYITWRFWLRQYFRSWRGLFYPQGVKVIPNEVFNKIGPFSLAVWYMDDGNLSHHRCLTIATNQFEIANIRQLLIALRKRFDIVATVTNQRRIYITSGSVDTFFNIISPFIISSMKYKLS